MANNSGRRVVDAGPVSRRIEDLLAHEGRLVDVVMQGTVEPGTWADSGVSDFMLGNPKEVALPELVDALRDAAVPRGTDWYAYMTHDEAAQRAVASGLEERFGLPFRPEDICLTCGAFGGLAAVLQVVLDPGDEVLVNEPAWPFYSMMTRAVEGTPVGVDVRPGEWGLDLEAISRALSPRTRAIVVNTPNNPTGKVYSPATLEALARLLEGASEKNGRRVYQISDESYNRIVYDERQFPSPAQSYAATFVVHTYAKTILAPGLRIGYIALPPGMAGRASLRRALAATQIASGWTFPTSLLQRVVPALERMSIDLEALQHRRDRMVSELTAIGYRVHVPEGTFYLIPESPIDDAVAFAGMLRKHGILVIPGTGTLRGHFRISLTATEDMVERSFEGFRAAFAEATAGRRA